MYSEGVFVQHGSYLSSKESFFLTFEQRKLLFASFMCQGKFFVSYSKCMLGGRNVVMQGFSLDSLTELTGDWYLLHYWYIVPQNYAVLYYH